MTRAVNRALEMAEKKGVELTENQLDCLSAVPATFSEHEAVQTKLKDAEAHFKKRDALDYAAIFSIRLLELTLLFGRGGSLLKERRRETILSEEDERKFDEASSVIAAQRIYRRIQAQYGLTLGGMPSLAKAEQQLAQLKRDRVNVRNKMMRAGIMQRSPILGDEVTSVFESVETTGLTNAQIVFRVGDARRAGDTTTVDALWRAARARGWSRQEIIEVFE